MAGEIERYLEARAAFEQSSARTAELLHVVVSVGEALKSNPARFMFANCEPGMPMEVALGRGAFSFDANRWPTAQQIQIALSGWHAAKSKMEGAWDAVPNHLRSGLQPPSTAQPK